jgi:hypothetical protein
MRAVSNTRCLRPSGCDIRRLPQRRSAKLGAPRLQVAICVKSVKPFLHENSPIVRLSCTPRLWLTRRDVEICMSVLGPPVVIGLRTEIVGKDGKIRRAKELMIILVQQSGEAVWCTN